MKPASNAPGAEGMINHKQFGQTEHAVGWADLFGFALLLAVISGVVVVAREWNGPLRPVAEIHLEPAYLPLYTALSLSRGLAAFGLSFLFTMAYGSAMVRVRGAERVMLPVLDILQSIPVLGFLPGFVLVLMQLSPQRSLGLEMASVLMIFTGQVWNMTFSFYASLKSLPPELIAVSRLAKFSWWQRFVHLDLSFAAHGLVWNSMLSMAGGWFFLTVCESFTLGEHNFRLPGLGSYVTLAIERDDSRAQALGVLAMLVMIVGLDQLVWHPILAWSRKFTDEEHAEVPASWFWGWLRRSRVWRTASHSVTFLRRRAHPVWTPTLRWFDGQTIWTDVRRWAGRSLLFMVGVAVTIGVAKYIHLLAAVRMDEWLHLLGSAATTLLRCILAVSLASLWAVPVGVWIGGHPRWARVLQPFIQMAASFPAPMIFPIALGVALAFGAGPGLSSILLLMLGTQWYVLFNVVAGSRVIPRELADVARISAFSWARNWRTVILPAIFPSLLTGWITATGGAWNASIVAECLKYKGQTLNAGGLGAAINQATEQGNFHVLAAAVSLMALAVVGFNRLVWRPLSHRAQARFSLST
jgi:NitT/TauT family transport system permease protein